MWDGHQFNNTLQDNGQLTDWKKCNAGGSEIQQSLARWRLTHKLDKMRCKMVRNSTIFILQNDGQLTNWTKCHARWSEIQQHLARSWQTHSLDKMSFQKVRNSTTPCKMMVHSRTGWNVIWGGQTFNNILQDNGQLTNYMKCDTRWSTFDNTLQDDGQLTNWKKCDARWSKIQQHLARWWSTHKLHELSCQMVRHSTIPCRMTVNSQAGQNKMPYGQKFNNTLWDDSQLTNWTKCHARWLEIQQHLVRWCSTHFLDKLQCEMVSNSTIHCTMTIDSLPGWMVMWSHQKFNNTLQDEGQLTDWINVMQEGQKFNNTL